MNENDKSTIEKLRNEIEHLNTRILDKISTINTLDDDSNTKLNKLHELKEIITSQRQEISWKNDDLGFFEEKMIKLTEEIFELEGQGKISSDSKTSESEMTELKRNIDELEKGNQGKIDELNRIIADLQRENNSLRSKNIETTGIEDNKQLITEIKNLKIKIAELEAINKKNGETNQMLKAALLMTVEKETKNIAESPETIKEEKVVMIETSKKTVAITQGPSTVKAPIEEENPEHTGRKRQCPKCGATSAFILEVDDKSHVIYINMGKTFYGKKYKCGDCRHEWK